MSESKSIEWSDEQSNILNWFNTGDGNLVVRARAGTGKTTTLLEGVSRASEGRILLTAFNKSIATELQSRIRGPAEAKTLHALGFSIITKMWGRTKMDKDRGKRIAEKAAKNLYGNNVPYQVLTCVRKLVSMVKSTNPDAEIEDIIDIAERGDYSPGADAGDGDINWDVTHVAEITSRALDLAVENDGCIDFDDMVYIPVRLRWRNPTYQLVCIDEAQDMSKSQLTLAMSVALPKSRIAVIGDDRQAIYGWRGADSNSLDRMKRELQARELPMTITRRCPKKVVRLASQLVPDFRAAPEAPDGSVIHCGTDAMIASCDVGDFVLSRKNVPLVRACLSILKTGKKAMIRGRDLGQNLLTLVRNLKATTMKELYERLKAWEEREVEKALKNTRTAEEKVDLLHEKVELIQAIGAECSNVMELMSRLDCLFGDDSKGAVICSTVHRAKGLEANRVYMMMDTLFNFTNTASARAREEDNIRYVGFTRAKKELVLVAEPPKPGKPDQRGQYGEYGEYDPEQDRRYQ